jgi:hypothetical protein
MQKMFCSINEIIALVERHGVIKAREKFLGLRTLIDRRQYMQQEYRNK